MTPNPRKRTRTEELDGYRDFTAACVRAAIDKRNCCFAAACLDFLGMKITAPPHPLSTKFTNWNGYRLDENKESLWDEDIGYPAVEAFKTNQVPAIEKLVKEHLEMRGFKVISFELALEGVKGEVACQNDPLECLCPSHGIFLHWELECPEPEEPELIMITF
jgi:hypothetical protein